MTCNLIHVLASDPTSRGHIVHLQRSLSSRSATALVEKACAASREVPIDADHGPTCCTLCQSRVVFPILFHSDASLGSENRTLPSGSPNRPHTFPGDIRQSRRAEEVQYVHQHHKSAVAVHKARSHLFRQTTERCVGFNRIVRMGQGKSRTGWSALPF